MMSSGQCPFAAQWRRGMGPSEGTEAGDDLTGSSPSKRSAAATTAGPVPPGAYGYGSAQGEDLTAISSGVRSCPLGFGSAPGVGVDGMRCPLGFGHSGNTASVSRAALLRSGLPRMPLAVLAAHGRNEASQEPLQGLSGVSVGPGSTGVSVRLVSVKGVVFDVSHDEEFRPLGKLALLPGHDASRWLAVSSAQVGEACGRVCDVDSLDAGLHGLRYQEHQKLETYYIEMVRSRRAVAVLANEDYERIFGASLHSSVEESEQPLPFAQAALTSSQQAAAAMAASKLHSAVEKSDIATVKEVLGETLRETGERDSSASASALESPPPVKAIEGGGERESWRKTRIDRSGIVDAICPRTGMTPLLKGVEGASEEIVKLLLGAGADTRAKAALYDDDDAIALTRRLGSRRGILDILLAADKARSGEV